MARTLANPEPSLLDKDNPTLYDFNLAIGHYVFDFDYYRYTHDDDGSDAGEGWDAPSHVLPDLLESFSVGSIMNALVNKFHEVEMHTTVDIEDNSISVELCVYFTDGENDYVGETRNSLLDDHAPFENAFNKTVWYLLRKMVQRE